MYRNESLGGGGASRGEEDDSSHPVPSQIQHRNKTAKTEKQIGTDKRKHDKIEKTEITHMA